MEIDKKIKEVITDSVNGSSNIIKMKNGIDVSANNGLINWSEVANKNSNFPVDFCFIKASEGVGYTDAKFLINASTAKNAGLKIGYYHFASLNSAEVEKDATKEAEYFLAIINNAPKPDLPLILDIEKNSISLSREKVLTYIKTFFSVLEKNKHEYAIYSYTPFLNANLPANHGLGNIKLWIAGYVPESSLKIPNGWSDYWIWQFSCKGNLVGIKGNVDLNIVR